MSYSTKCIIYNSRFLICRCLRRSCSSVANQLFEEEEFKKLELIRREVPKKKKDSNAVRTELLQPRYLKMPVNQDWPSVWPVARSFHPASVPLPLRQGYVEKGTPPGRFANAELMKIPNFLHLTPPAIKRQCEVLKNFCTPWPDGLKTDEDCEKHFPIEIISNDFCHAGPTIRDVRARIVTLQIKLSNLNLDYHARDKLLRLVGERYDKKTDILSLVADRCPLRRQNYDYTMYLLTALYHESWKVEPWESEKTEADMEKFFYEGSRSQKKVAHVLNRITAGEDVPVNEEKMKERREVKEYGEVLTSILNEGENQYTIQKYKDVVCRLLNIQPPDHSSTATTEIKLQALSSG